MKTFKYGNTVLTATTIERAVVEFNYYLNCTDITVGDVTEDVLIERDYGRYPVEETSEELERDLALALMSTPLSLPERALCREILADHAAAPLQVLAARKLLH